MESFWSTLKLEPVYRRVEGSHGVNPSHHQGDNLPVEEVSWEDAMAFCRRLTAMAREAGVMEEGWELGLPMEAE